MLNQSFNELTPMWRRWGTKPTLGDDNIKFEKTNLAIWPEQVLLGKFQKYIFCPIIIPTYTAKFQKNPSSGSWDTKLHNFDPKRD